MERLNQPGVKRRKKKQSDNLSSCTNHKSWNADISETNEEDIICNLT